MPPPDNAALIDNIQLREIDEHFVEVPNVKHRPGIYSDPGWPQVVLLRHPVNIVLERSGGRYRSVDDTGDYPAAPGLGYSTETKATGFPLMTGAQKPGWSRAVQTPTQ